MAATKVYTCDECGIKRGESNHWFVAYQNKELTFGGWDFGFSGGALLRNNESSKHLCGHVCAVKHLEKYLNRIAR